MKVGPLTNPAGQVTETGPVLAPVGTLVVRVVVVDAVTVAAVPLKLTASWLGVVLNPVPYIVTLVPTAPDDGESW